MPRTRNASASWMTTTNFRRTANLVLVLVLVLLGLARFNAYRQGDAAHTSSSSATTLTNNRIAAQEKAVNLDRQYELGLQRQPKPPAARLLALYGDKAAGSRSKYTATIVLGRLHNESSRVQWLDDLVDFQKPEVYIVDDASTDLPHLEKNHGREAAVYLTHIINNYNNLTDITFFWHSDEIVWHNNLLMQWNSVTSINRMDREHIMRQGYVPSRCDHWPGCPQWIHFNPSKAEHSLDPHRLESMFTPDFFKQIFPDVAEDDFPPYFAGTCCSQFAVSRNAIHSRPVETYQRLLNWILEYKWDDLSGTVLEYTWPYVFLGRGSFCPSMQECYCKTYNFCLEDQAEIEQIELWNALRTRREEVKWQVTFTEKALETKQKDLKAKGASAKEIDAVETTFGPELERLNGELSKLEQKTWLRREDIIKHWQLGAPPVGW